MYKRFCKRILDLIIAVIGLILLSPLFLLIAFLLLFLNKGKVFFLQSRPGLNENIFTILKFSTMNEERNVKGILLPDSERITPLGKFLRRTSLDELPQLWNVVAGDMSLVGPRPLLVEYLSHYNIEQKKRHSVKPGITGLAQVNGRNALTWEAKFQYDVMYTRNISLAMDVKIMFLTLNNFFRSGDNDEFVLPEKFSKQSDTKSSLP